MSLVSLGVLAKNTCTEGYGDEGSSYPNLVSNDEVVQSLGFGFVRGIDGHRKLMYVVTPLTLDQLVKVNCLSMGAVSLPKGIIVNQKQNRTTVKTGAVPYR